MQTLLKNTYPSTAPNIYSQLPMLADSSKILYEYIAEQLINMGPAVMPAMVHKPEMTKPLTFSNLSIAKKFLMSGIKMTMNLA